MMSKETCALSPELRLLPVGSCCAEKDGDPSGDTRCVTTFLPPPKATARGRRSAPAPPASVTSDEVLKPGPAQHHAVCGRFQ